MYEQTFNFSSRPFNNVPCPEHFFAGPSHQQALDLTQLCVDRSSGPVVMIGAPGMGKSLMLQKVGQAFQSRFDIVHIECSRLEQRSELLQSILFELDLTYSGLSEGELRLNLMRYLKQNERSNDGVLLLVDEADRLSVELIDELRLITNHVRQGRSIVQLVLAGTQRLEESLSDPKLASFNQRIAARCLLQNLCKSETGQFIHQHVQRAGRRGDEVFNSDAIAQIHQSTDGCPRLINQLCDQALILAASRNMQPIDQTLIREAWAEMQNLPQEPQQCDEQRSDPEGSLFGQGASWSVVEFGQLGDAKSETSETSETSDAMTPEDTSGNNADATDPFAASESDPAAEATSLEVTETTPAGLHFAAPSLGNFNADPFAPQDTDQTLQDDNTEADRISSLEQEQDELFQQTRASTIAHASEYSNNNADETSSANDEEVRSAFEVLGLNDQGIEPPVVDEMIPADPFQLPDGDNRETEPDSIDSIDSARQFPSQLRAKEDTVGSTPDESQLASDDVQRSAFDGGISSPIAQRSIEEQLGLVEPDTTEPTSVVPSSFHPPAVEPRPYVESHVVDTSTMDDAEPSSTPQPDGQDPFVDPFAESFEEEEMLQDAYSPFVAQQNQSSLDVTSDQLSHLTPLDENEDSAPAMDSWNPQTPELAIEEFDNSGIASESPFDGQVEDSLEDVTAIGEGDFISKDSLQGSTEINPTHASEPPSEVWQNNPDTSFSQPQFELPQEIQQQTPATFKPIPSVPTELGPVSFDHETAPSEAGGITQDPFAPPVTPPVEAPVSDSPITAAEQTFGTINHPPGPAPNHESVTDSPVPATPIPDPPAIDADLAALTSDLDAAAIFDGADQLPASSDAPQQPTDSPPHPTSASDDRHNNMLDLNDLVPGHMLPQIEASHLGPHDVAADPSDGSPSGQRPSAPSDYPFTPGQFESAPPMANTPPASPVDTGALQAEAQHEARRNAEEFMRSFQPQGAGQPQPHIPEGSGVSHETQSPPMMQAFEQPHQTDGANTPPGALSTSAPAGQSTHVGIPPEGQSQEILKEIFSQQQILDQVHYTQPAHPLAQEGDPASVQMPGVLPSQDHGADSVSTEYPVTEHGGYQQLGPPPAVQDDRDMLYVNESQQYNPPQPPPTPQVPLFPTVETSTGSAERMDYNQLFDQLRNTPKD